MAEGAVILETQARMHALSRRQSKRARPTQIVVSARSDDVEDAFARLFERLVQYFGETAISLLSAPSTVTSLEPSLVGDAHQEADHLDAVMRECSILLVFIGPHWLESIDQRGRRLHMADDTDRRAIEAALAHNIPVVPVLLAGAALPPTERLPPTLQLMFEQGHAGSSSGKDKSQTNLLALIARTGLAIRPDPDFTVDSQRLFGVIETLGRVAALDPQLAHNTARQSMVTAAVIGGGILAALAAFQAFLPVAQALQNDPAATHSADVYVWIVTIAAPVVSLVAFALVGNWVGRRTGIVRYGVLSALLAEACGCVVGAVALADALWTNWNTVAVPDTYGSAQLVGDPSQYIISFVIIVVVGLLGSLSVGWLGALRGVNAYTRADARRRANRRRTLLFSAPSNGGTARRQVAQVPVPVSDSAVGGAHNPANSLGKVFISYRRADSGVIAGYLYDRLVEIFGIDVIFKDVDAIPVGSNFKQVLDTVLAECAVQIVVIGPTWLSITDATGARRLDDPTDVVRQEVESALRSGIKVIPVLVNGATLPPTSALPPNLRALTDCVAVTVRATTHFHEDMRQLANLMTPTMSMALSPHQRTKRHNSILGRSRERLAASLTLARHEPLSLLKRSLPTVALVAYSVLAGTSGADGVILFVSALVVIPILAAISGIEVAAQTGRARQAVWTTCRRLAMSYVVCVIVTVLTDQDIQRPADVVTAAVVALLIWILGIGPCLLIAWGAAQVIGVHVFNRRLQTRKPSRFQLTGNTGSRVSRTRRRLLVLQRMEDAAVSVPIIAELTRRFGRRTVDQSWQIQRMRWSQTPARLAVVERVKRSAALALLIGPAWLGTTDTNGARRVDDPDDELRLAIEAALALRVPIIPIYAGGAQVPRDDQLPESLRELRLLNGAWVRNGADFASDMRRVVHIVQAYTGIRARTLWTGELRRSVLIIGSLGALALIVHGLVLDVAACKMDVVQWPLTWLGSTPADAIVEMLVGLFIARRTGRIRDALLVVISLILGSEAVSDGALLYLATHHGEPIAHVTAGTSLALLSGALILDVLCVPLGILGGLAFSWLGALLGRGEYARTERKEQERALYAALQTQVAQNAAHEGQTFEPRGLPTAQTLLDDRTTAKQTGTPSRLPADVARRDEIVRASALLYRRRAQRIRRTYALVAVLTCVMLGLSVVVGRQVSSIQASVRTQQATAVAHYLPTYTALAQLQRAADRATATAMVSAPNAPYYTTLPGEGCDPGGAIWSNIFATSQCKPNEVVYSVSGTEVMSSSMEYGDLQTFEWLQFGQHYAVDVETTLLTPGLCSGLFTHGQIVQGGYTYSGYGYLVCDTGAWEIVVYANDDRTSPPRVLAHGSGIAASHYSLHVVESGIDKQFSINGQVVASVTDTTYTTTSYLALVLDPTTASEGSAAFSRFRYQPLN